MTATPSAASRSLVLRLAGPLQSWGGHSEFNRRDTQPEPTKSGVVGLLAAAQGRRRQDPIEDLVNLRLGVRTDQPGSMLRDYHTVSDLRGRPLLSASVNAKGVQKTTTPQKPTHVTRRFYLQDAVFVVAVSGPVELLTALAEAMRRPAFPLSLGRRSCPPSQPLIVRPDNGSEPEPDVDPALWTGVDVKDVLRQVPWQARQDGKKQQPTVVLPVTLDDPDGDDVRADLPVSFDPLNRDFSSRRIRHDWVQLDTGASGPETSAHDPFALLGW
nr:type I-E CRISPR-associated protein Cas5/CasD [Micromonospora sp. DSM 115978]